MAKVIDTLIPDIKSLLIGGGHTLTSLPEFTERLAKRIGTRVENTRTPSTLRLSNLGKPCRRQLWYSINLPGMGDPLSAETELKFLYGDLIEETVLWLAKEAGHKVEGEQDEVNLFGVVGHVDAVVDGILVDVKSASSYSFNRFESHLHTDVDPFGYLTQLDAYLVAGSQTDTRLSGRLRDTSKAAFLAVDKTLGKICLDFHPKSVVNYKVLVDETRTLLSKSFPPSRHYSDEEFGKSGNRKLGTVCSYCNFKRHCWPDLRTFLYSTGPVYLTKVMKTPEVHEFI